MRSDKGMNTTDAPLIQEPRRTVLQSSSMLTGYSASGAQVMGSHVELTHPDGFRLALFLRTPYPPLSDDAVRISLTGNMLDLCSQLIMGYLTRSFVDATARCLKASTDRMTHDSLPSGPLVAL